MSRIMLVSISLAAMVSVAYLVGCTKLVKEFDETTAFKSSLSEYNIYKGDRADLSPSLNFIQYEIATELFSDNADKQRLIKLPAGSKLQANDGYLPEFPDSTIIVKTFFYHHNSANPSLGKKIIETRLLVKINGKWNAATYLWNKEQTDARLISSGADILINWIDGQGQPRVINYHVPSKAECGMCHQSGKEMIPIGPKLRNLNREVVHDGNTVNQLQLLQDKGILAAIDPANVARLPDWRNERNSLEARARAYLDVNCGHCHNKNGLADDASGTFTYETSFDDSKIGGRKKAIEKSIEKGTMPLIGTTVVDEEALRVIKKYFQTLR